MGGRRLGKYTLEQPIGSGGMGEVHLARFSGPGGFARQVAIKLLRPSLVDCRRGRELFLQEGRALAALSHRNVIQVIELAADGDDLFLVMEYLRGVDLGRVMRREGALPWQVATYAVAEAARGVAAAHAHGIAHSDVSPSNVFLCVDGAVKVLDFGLAGPVGPAAGEGGGVRGKLPYLPPEVLLGAPADALADVYGLGVVLHECLTGTPLFRAGDDEETVRRVLRDPVPAPSERADVPRDLDRVVAGAMARDRAARTGSALALADQLDASLDGAFTAADMARWVPARIGASEGEPAASSLAPTRPRRTDNRTEVETPLERPRRPGKRRRSALWIAAGGAATLAVAGLLHLASADRDPAPPAEPVADTPVTATPAAAPVDAAEGEDSAESEVVEPAAPAPPPRTRPREPRRRRASRPAAAPREKRPAAEGLAPGTLADPFE